MDFGPGEIDAKIVSLGKIADFGLVKTVATDVADEHREEENNLILDLGSSHCRLRNRETAKSRNSEANLSNGAGEGARSN